MDQHYVLNLCQIVEMVVAFPLVSTDVGMYEK